MKLIITFSGRSEGNCAAIAGHIGGDVVRFADLHAHGCADCAYECFHGECPHRADGVYDLYSCMTQYDQVILDTAQERWQPINDRIGADYRGFLEELAYLQDTPPAQWEQMLQDMGAVYGNFLATCTPEVTCNGGDIFSIRMTRDWFLGGVYNRDYYGLNFDLTTGEELMLSRLSPLPEEAFLKQLKEIVSAALADNRDALFEDPAVILEDFTLADFSYCIEDRELVLLFPTYTFGPGVLGATEIATGLYPSL